jgi:hypothetical protein
MFDELTAVHNSRAHALRFTAFYELNKLNEHIDIYPQ